MPSRWQKTAQRLAIILRLSVLLHRSRSSVELPDIRIIASKRNIELKFPSGWLDVNPLTITDLEREQHYLAAVNYRLSFGD